MTRQIGIYGIIILVALAAGAGIGVMVANKKINAAGRVIADLQTQQAQTVSDLNAANTKLSRLEAELTKSRNDVMRKNTELLRAQTELGRMKSVLDQTLNPQQEPAPAVQTPTAETPTASAAQPPRRFFPPESKNTRSGTATVCGRSPLRNWATVSALRKSSS